MHSLDFRIVIIKKGEIMEAMSSKVILMMPKNQESSKIQRFKNQASSFKIQDSIFKIQESRLKNQDSRIIKIKIQDSRFKNQEKTQSR